MKHHFSVYILGFSPHWDYKHFNEYISQKIINLSTLDKILFKCDVIDGSVVNGIREPKLLSFKLDKPKRYRVLCEPETVHYKK